MFFKKSKTIQSQQSQMVISDASHKEDFPESSSSTVKSNTEKNQDPVPPKATSPEDVEYPSGLKLGLLLTSVFLGMCLVSLDRVIIATAIPQITDDFNSVTDIGWYGSAYLLTTCAFQLLFGKIYTFFSIKITFLTSIAVFEVGSAVCGAAPSSIAFIIGRAVAGVGGAGILTGVMMSIVYTVPLHKRPLYQGMVSAIFGLASIVGPLIGGAFTSNVTWRWCFYINLPLGGAAMVVIMLLLKIPDRETTKLPLKAKLLQLDVYGTAFIMPGSVCLILALQWGGSVYPWKDGRVIALLVLAGVFLLGFVLVQAFLPKTATLPPRIFMQRSILAGSFVAFCTGAQMMMFTYYLPVWFQAIQGVSAVDSGIHLLPLLISMFIASVSSGALIRRIGYYTPFGIAGVVFMSVGAGLLNTLQLDTSTANWIGYQILYGWGLGLAVQIPSLAAQTVLPKQDVAIGATLMMFSQLLSGAVFLSVGQNVLNNQLLGRLSSISDFNSEAIKNIGATSLTDLPEPTRSTVLVAYNESLRALFRVGMIVTCITIIGSVIMEWRSTRKDAIKPIDKSGEKGEPKLEEQKHSTHRQMTSKDDGGHV